MKHRHTYSDVTKSIAAEVHCQTGKWPWGAGSIEEKLITDLIERAFIQLADDDGQGEVGYPITKTWTGASRLTVWLCGHGIHPWVEFRRESIRSVYLTRRCGYCKAEQIKHIGPSGDGKWHPLGNWRNDWEREDFLNAK